MATVPERHVAVFAFPFSSHPPLLLRLVRRLAAAAPTAVFSFFSTEKSNRALFADLRCPNIRPYGISDGKPENYELAGKPQEEINLFLAVAEEELRRGVRAAEAEIGRSIGCLVVDAFFWFAGEMAEEMKVPWVAFWTAGAGALSAHFYTDLIRKKIGYLKAAPEGEITDLIPGFPTVRLGDLPSEVVFGDLESPFSTMLHNMGRTLAKATAIPINSFEELDPSLTKNLASNFKKFLNIGPFNLISKQNPRSKTDEFSCISWLDAQKARSVVYICFGTVVKPPPHELLALAEALQETEIPFLWSINDDSKKHFPDAFLKRTATNGTGKVVPWAPQVQVLDHMATAVFVTHGGWNSVLESIGAGVPMICRPFFGDQHINAWMVEKVWVIGTRIEGGVFTKSGSQRALQHVLSSENLRARIEGLKEMAHKAVEPNGSSHRNFKTLVDVVMDLAM